MSQDSLDDLRADLERTRAELRGARERIAMMEMSFFWRLRNAWWAFKAMFRSEDSGAGPPPRNRGVAWHMPTRVQPPDPDPTGGRFTGKRVLFLLPVAERGGGANIVLREALAMRSMGVDARVVNLRSFEDVFRRAYADSRVPVAFATPGEMAELARGFDAVVATANRSVEWLLPLAGVPGGPVLGYYVQDFEPYFYAEGSAGWKHALESYTLVPGLVRFAKTEWNAREVEARCGVPCAVVGPSLDTTIFRPLGGRRPAPPPVRISAMIRPSSPRRQPELTLRVFERVHERFGDSIDFTLFGVDPHDPAFRRMSKAFPHRHLGVASDERLAELFNETHVFADFSTYQAMGLTAMEAMACGAAVIVPAAGGASSFAADGRNALVVDTSRSEACEEALVRLVEDAGFAARLGAAACPDMETFRPGGAAARILACLFEPAPVSAPASARGS